jgi:hypothetical protein
MIKKRNGIRIIEAWWEKILEERRQRELEEKIKKMPIDCQKLYRKFILLRKQTKTIKNEFSEFAKEKFSHQVDYYENRFKTIGLDNNENIIIKDNILYLKYLNKSINDFNDYNLTFSLLKEIEENRFLLQQYMKFDLYPKKNLFNKYIETYLNFFKDLFLKDNSCLKSLFIKTFPVLKSNYFINEEFLEYIFHNKIYLFNFYNSEFVGLTEHSNLNIFLKGNYSKNNKDKLENEICIFASFIVILIPELAYFIKMYIYKYLKIAEYESSFYYLKDEKSKIGRFIEKKFF